jgi:branched-subunit amino acid transport system permease
MMALWRDMPVRGRLLAGLLLVVLLAAPLFADRYLLSVLILIFYFAYLGQAWNLMMGLAGQLSLGHALHVGLGAYVAAMLWVYLGWGPWLGVVPAVAVAAIVGAAIAWLGFRFSIEGVYFALLTIAFAEFTRIGFDHIGAAGGAGGFFLPYQAQRLGEWWNLRGGQGLFYYAGLTMACGAVILTAWLKGSRLGYQWLAVHTGPTVVVAVGRCREQALSWPAGNRRGELQHRARRAVRDHRPQWGRQDHIVQYDRRRDRSRSRHDLICGRAHRWAHTRPHLRARHRTHLTARAAVSGAQRRG